MIRSRCRVGMGRAGQGLAVAGLLVGLAACGPKHRLAQYDFTGRTIAVAHFPTPAPELITARHTGGSDDPVAVVVSAGSRIAMEVEGRRARARLDSAATRVDAAARVAERTLERASRYLGAHPVHDRAGADFLLEVDVREVSIDARGSRATLRIRSEVVLLDGHSGREIWSARVRTTGPLTPDVDTGGVVPSEAITAGALTSVSVEDFERGIERLSDLAADWVGRELRDALTKTRRR
jgi:hypothetical protein